MAECPECGAEIKAENVEIGEILNCQDCGSELEVRKLNPVVLELAPQEAEDWGQ
ncbi:MAG: lysine biosynthesis protein LysW [Candidatus Woesearchaeota archaeon]